MVSFLQQMVNFLQQMVKINDNLLPLRIFVRTLAS